MHETLISFAFAVCLKGTRFQGSFRLNISKRLFPQRVVRHWTGFPGKRSGTTPVRAPETFGQCSQINGGILGVSCAGAEAGIW